MRIWESALAKEMVLEADGLEQEFAQRKRVGIEHRTFFNHKTAIEEMLGIEIKNDGPSLCMSNLFQENSDVRQKYAPTLPKSGSRGDSGLASMSNVMLF